MRVNIYAEEMTERVQIISKEIEGQTFTGLRLYLELPVTVGGGGAHRSAEGPTVFPPINGEPAQISGPFLHHPGDDDSAAITFWGKKDLRVVLRKMLAELDAHYDRQPPQEAAAPVPDDFETAKRLWQLLDDIDTLDDVHKFDAQGFREGTRTILAKRHALLESDGYELYRPGSMPDDGKQPVTPRDTGA